MRLPSVLPPLLFGMSCVLCTTNADAAVESNSSRVVPAVQLQLPTDNPHKTIPVKLIPYDEKAYQLAYQVFLANNNVKDAYTIAAAAVLQQPSNLYWRKRLAQVAVWQQHPMVALDQYRYIAANTYDREMLSAGIKLAKGLAVENILRELLWTQIQYDIHNENDWDSYIQVMMHLGEPQTVIKQLKERKQQLSLKFYLAQLAELYHSIADITTEQKVLMEYSRSLGITPINAEKLSQIYLTKGQLKPAYRLLSAASNKATDKDKEFWLRYAPLSAALNQPEQEIIAYQHLLSQKDFKELSYSHLIVLSQIYNPLLAYQYTKKAKQSFPDSADFALEALIFASDTGRWREIPYLLTTTNTAIRQKLLTYADFWAAIAGYWRDSGNSQQANASYVDAIKHFPDNNNLKINYIEFLASNGEARALQPVLQQFRYLLNYPGFWNALIFAYNQAHNTIMRDNLLNRYLAQWSTYQYDPYWLTGATELFENLNYPTQAHTIARIAWPKYLAVLSKQQTPLEYNQLISLVKLSQSQAAGDTTATALAYLQQMMTPEAASLILSWAISQNNFALAGATYRYAQLCAINLPSQPVITWALQRNDMTLIGHLVRQYGSALSSRDQVKAAAAIGNIPLAQTAAYHGLALSRHDADLYDSFQEMAFKTASVIKTGWEYDEYGPVVGPKTQVAVTDFVIPSTSVTPYVSFWRLQDASPTILATTPPVDNRVGIKTVIAQHRGDLTLDIGYRDNLTEFVTALIARQYQLSSNIGLNLTAGYHQPTDETAGALLGGMKNLLQLDTSYRLTNHDNLLAELKESAFYTQDGEHVANGAQQTLRLEHTISQHYPDWTLSVYGTTAQYGDETNALTGSILTMVPTGTPANSSFLVPPNFNEYGANLSLGTSIEENYNHNWRPFATATIWQNSATGPGKLLEFGMAGRVFGKDHLQLYYEQSINSGIGINTIRIMKIAYQFYF